MPPGGLVARPDEQAVQPRVEAVGVAQAPKVQPRLQQRVLERIGGAVLVAQDQPRDGGESPGLLGCQFREGVNVAMLATA